MQQGLSLKQVRDDVTNSVLTPSMAERFELTEEQLVRIAMEDGICIKDGIYSNRLEGLKTINSQSSGAHPSYGGSFSFGRATDQIVDCPKRCIAIDFDIGANLNATGSSSEPVDCIV
jgi:hypothetical protein